MGLLGGYNQAEQGSNDKEMAKTYQEGLKSAPEGKKNQELWAQGKGNPEMAKAYQEGMNAAEEGKRNQQRWANEQG